MLTEIGAGEVPRLTVLNKIDLAGLEPRVARGACGSIDRLWASAITGAGIDVLRDAIEEQVAQWRARRFGAASEAVSPQAPGAGASGTGDTEGSVPRVA